MAIPAVVMDLLKRPDTTKILVTACKCGQPHAIVCGSIIPIDENTVGVGQVLMQKTVENMKDNPKVSIEVLDGKAAYELRGEVIGAQTEGPGLEQMNAMLGKIGLKASALWTFNIKEVYDESAGPNAGKQIA